jgi:adenosine kinase
MAEIRAAVAEGALLGMGNPLLDISANVDADLLKKYELKENLAILAEKQHLPLYDELVKNYKVSYVAGGATQNTIRVAQWMLGKPKATTFIGCTGKDEYSDRLRECAEANDVRVEYLQDESTPTGTCAVLVTGKHRTLVANISAANNYKIEHLQQPDVWALVEAAKVYYISGFFLTVSPPSILKVAEHAAAHNKPFCMNLAAPFISEFFTAPLMETSPYWDIIFGNETEAEAFSKANNFGTTDLKEIATKMAALPKANDKRSRIVIITHGSEPTIVYHDDKITEFPVDLVPDDQIVDTNGAGDAFVSGFLAEFVAGRPLKECLHAGQWAAKVIIQHEGCTFPEECTFKEYLESKKQ